MTPDMYQAVISQPRQHVSYRGRVRAEQVRQVSALSGVFPESTEDRSLVDAQSNTCAVRRQPISVTSPVGTNTEQRRAALNRSASPTAFGQPCCAGRLLSRTPASPTRHPRRAFRSENSISAPVYLRYSYLRETNKGWVRRIGVRVASNRWPRSNRVDRLLVSNEIIRDRFGCRSTDGLFLFPPITSI